MARDGIQNERMDGGVYFTLARSSVALHTAIILWLNVLLDFCHFLQIKL